MVAVMCNDGVVHGGENRSGVFLKAGTFDFLELCRLGVGEFSGVFSLVEC